VSPVLPTLKILRKRDFLLVPMAKKSIRRNEMKEEAQYCPQNRVRAMRSTLFYFILFLILPLSKLITRRIFPYKNPAQAGFFHFI
jgi:hypothetical protein